MMWPRRSASEIRTVEVVSPSWLDEGGKVLIAAGYIMLCIIYAYGFERQAAQNAATAQGSATLLPYQVLFRDLPSDEQRMFRAMQEGGGEALRARGTSGTWPSAGALAASGVPPFALDVLDKSGYRWTDRREGLVVNYLGVPAAADRAAFLIMVQEPDPVTGERPPPLSVVDEEHQLLAGGILLHVTYWKRSAANLADRLVVDPALQGWKQIRLKTFFEEMDQR